MVSSPLPRTLQPPPDVPALKADAPTLTNYLRNFALWCRHGFADKLSTSMATPAINFSTPSGQVYALSVADDGTVVTTAVKIGSGSP